MKVVGLAGYSGSGKTTLATGLIAALRGLGLRVSVIKHAHHGFDIDQPGKDSWRHRQAGAYEVLVASDRRMALMREFANPAELSLHGLIAALDPGVDWVLVEGFKHGSLPKIEVWRAATNKPVRYPEDDKVVAIATDSPGDLPQPTARPVASEQVSTFDADGRVQAADLVSALQVPPQDNSAMDGYAVRVADAKAGAELPVSQRIPAGSSGTPLASGTVARIFTGAPVPAGADALVMQEDCTPVADGVVRIGRAPAPGQWIRRAGEDVTRGAVVLAKGERLGPAGVGLAAGIGLALLPVARRPRVGLFSTGDELVRPGGVPPQDMPPGAIYN